MTLSMLAIGLGLLVALPPVYGLFKPAQFSAALRQFPRSVNWGYALMGLGTAWFLWNLHRETISDFEPFKTHMMVGFGLVGVLTCVYVKDFLAVRGLSVVLLLLSKVMLDTARWHDSSWKLVIAVWAYIWIVAAMWFIISPWRLRDFIQWKTDQPSRLRIGSALQIGFGLLLVVLGLAAF